MKNQDTLKGLNIVCWIIFTPGEFTIIFYTQTGSSRRQHSYSPL